MLVLMLASASLLSGGEVGVAPRELRLRLVEVINADRTAAGLPPVQYSDELSQAADAHCREMLDGNYASHWSRDGWKPYLRYASAGARDATSENIHALWTTDFRLENLWDYMLEGHQNFMAEEPPNDGHRRSVLGKHHTHVGIGVAFDGRGLRLIEVFGARYAALGEIPAQARLKSSPTIVGRLLRSNDRLLGIAIYYEPLPKPMSREELKATYSYGLPTEERMERPRLESGIYVDGTRGTILTSGKQFSLQLQFWKDKPGVYTIAVWIDPGRGPAFVGAMSSVIVEE